MANWLKPNKIVALILAIFSIILCWVPVMGISSGIIALMSTSKNFFPKPDKTVKAARTIAIIGTVLSGIFTVLMLFGANLMIRDLRVSDTTQHTALNETDTARLLNDAKQVFEKTDISPYTAVDEYCEDLCNIYVMNNCPAEGDIYFALHASSYFQNIDVNGDGEMNDCYSCLGNAVCEGRAIPYVEMNPEDCDCS